jgi:hypothetical protein
MAYKGHGGKPAELASKTAHSNIIHDETVAAFLNKCSLPALGEGVVFESASIASPKTPDENPIEHIIAIDGGFQDVFVRDEFPSARIAFFQIGALMFRRSDLESLDTKPFIEPTDMAKLQQIERFKFTFPTKNVVMHGEEGYKATARKAVIDFFEQPIDKTNLCSTLKWFIFEEYAHPEGVWTLAGCPYDDCDANHIDLKQQEITAGFTWKCPRCNRDIHITDTFRLHEVIDNEIGGSSVLSYMVTLLEHMFLVHLIKIMLNTKPQLLQKVLFVKDGPLAFFGQTANMHKPMRKLMNFLLDNHNIYLVGLEKSGTFQEHALEIQDKLQPGRLLLPSNHYIYQYIMPGKADDTRPYGGTTYYGVKTIYKADDGRVYVPILPTRETLIAPKLDDIPNVEIILSNLSKLKCDLYENALIPVALANKLVSLSDHPSAQLLQKFAKGSVT